MTTFADQPWARLLHDIARRLNAEAPYIHVDMFDPVSGWPQDRTEDGA